ncbi:MAG: hypothetical protein J5530_01350, partial [Clostridia bacterium]|nr:hypothetical protein [Clostridia bacterium]
ANARLVITHGGPSCYIDVLENGKIPIVVPRCHKFGEHVDDHQLEIGAQSEHGVIFALDAEEEILQPRVDLHALLFALLNEFFYYVAIGVFELFPQREPRLDRLGGVGVTLVVRFYEYHIEARVF